MINVLRLIALIPLSLIALAVTLPLIVVMAVGMCVSALVRYLPQVWEPELISWGDLIKYDPHIGWRPRPNMTAHHHVDRDEIFRIETDDEGWPVRGRTINESEVIVFGDSYASCYGANPGNTFADFESPEIKIKPIGAPGYNMVQELLLMEQLAPRLKDKLVVWFFYLENDLPDNLSPGMAGYRAPFIRRNQEEGTGWEIVTDHITPKKWQLSNKRDNIQFLANVCTPGPVSERVFSSCEFLIGRGKEVVENAGGRLAVFTIPYTLQLSGSGCKKLAEHVDPSGTFDPDYPDRELRKICDSLEVDFVASKQVLSATDYKRFETYHWTKSGHKKAAELIKDLYQRHTVNVSPQADKNGKQTQASNFQPAF